MDEIIYIVEDDEGIRELYEGAFEGVYTTKMFENGKDFFACFQNEIGRAHGLNSSHAT